MARHRLPRLRLLNRLQFTLERLFVRGAWFQLLVIAGLIGLISLLGGALVLPAAEEAGHFGEAVWWAFLRLTDPGYLGDDVGAWRRTVSTVLTVAGYVVFLGALVAILTQWLNARMRRLESGLTPVATRNHVVVLGWSNRTLPVVGEILQSEGRVKRFLARAHASRLRLVVLCDEVTAWHAQALRDDPAIGARGRHIVLRSGTPLAVDDLERVDCLNAAAVIVPSGGPGAASAGAGVPGALSSDMSTIKALLSLSSHPAAASRPLPYVVAEILDQRKVPVARRAYSGPLEVVSGNSLISRLMAQILRNRGLSRVYQELLSHRVGCGIYVREADGMAGRTIGEAGASYDRAVLCGLVRPGRGGFEPYLNPPSDMTIAPGDRLVFVAADYDGIVPAGASSARWPAASAAPAVSAGAASGVPRRLLVLGWNARVPLLLHELGTYGDESFEVTVVSLVSERLRVAALEEFGESATVGCRHVEADYVVEENLRALDPAAYDNVLLASSERLLSGEEADTRAVVAYLLLEALLDGADAAPELLLELQDPDNAPLLAGRLAETLISPQVLAHVVAQVALRRELSAVFDALFNADGPEIVLRDPGCYGDIEPDVDFGSAGAAVRTRGDTLLGIYHRASDELRLSPPASRALRAGPGDQFVVLTST